MADPVEYEFIVEERFEAVGRYAVRARTRAEALTKVLSIDQRDREDVATLGEPELIPQRAMTLRDVKRGPRLT